MTKTVLLSPPKGVLLVMDRDSGQLPAFDEFFEDQVAATDSCLALGTANEEQREILVCLTDDPPEIAPYAGWPMIFTGRISTPNRELHVCTFDAEIAASCRVQGESTQVTALASGSKQAGEFVVLVDADQQPRGPILEVEGEHALGASMIRLLEWRAASSVPQPPFTDRGREGLRKLLAKAQPFLKEELQVRRWCVAGTPSDQMQKDLEEISKEYHKDTVLPLTGDCVEIAQRYGAKVGQAFTGFYFWLSIAYLGTPSNGRLDYSLESEAWDMVRTSASELVEGNYNRVGRLTAFG